ncbi:hypothetical protein Vi05172_g11820 [Venturia inaequalis]|nr:hypothetical protein Vi05172_g11820 [Venturia inaequalis]
MQQIVYDGLEIEVGLSTGGKEDGVESLFVRGQQSEMPCWGLTLEVYRSSTSRALKGGHHMTNLEAGSLRPHSSRGRESRATEDPSLRSELDMSEDNPPSVRNYYIILIAIMAITPTPVYSYSIYFNSTPDIPHRTPQDFGPLLSTDTSLPFSTVRP